MKSRITIDVDYDNQPIIKIEYQESEDVRDKLVKRFMESFGGKSTFANFWYIDSLESSNTKAKIRPIGSDEAERIYDLIDKNPQENPQVKVFNQSE